MSVLKKIACKKVLFHDQHGTPKIQPAVITVCNSSILNVEKYDEASFSIEVKKHNDIKLLENKIITPTFINSHTHLAMSFFRGIDIAKYAKKNIVEDIFFKVEKYLSEEDVYFFTIMGAFECLSNGVGFVWDHYYHGNAAAEALLDCSLSGVVAPTLQDLSGPFHNQSKEHWDQTISILKNKDFKNAGIVAAFGPHATDTVSKNLWHKIKEASVELNIPFHSHIAQSIEEYEYTYKEYNKSPVAFLKDMGLLDSPPHALLVHNIFLEEDDFSKINKEKNTLCFCPFSQTIFAFQANIKMWQKNKLNWVVGTDCVASNDSMNIQKELRMLSSFPIQELSFCSEYENNFTRDKNILNIKNKRKKIWEETQIFREHNFLLDKVWSQPHHLHPHIKVGTISPEHLANFIVWDLDHPSLWPVASPRSFAFTDSMGAIENIMVSGNWIGDFSCYQESLKEHSVYKKALKESQKRLKRILEKI